MREVILDAIKSVIDRDGDHQITYIDVLLIAKDVIVLLLNLKTNKKDLSDET